MRKLLSTTIAVSMITSMSIAPVFADVAANTLPVFDKGTNVEVTTNNNNMNIKIDPTNQAQFAVGTAYWDSFNIGKDATVNVEFTAHNQTSLNYVNQAGGMSQIYGNFTNSGCNGCGYAGTGKVILINPNGVLFGNGANVNLNSFTASTMNGSYTQPSASAAGTLVLTKSGVKNDGIIVEDGAKIYGDKNVAFASDNINIYKGSQISTNTTKLNVDANSDKVNDTALGKVKLVTSDGVNFKYYNNAAIEKVENVKESADKMTLWVAGNITSGHIDMRNASTHTDSELNTNGAVLKAYKAAVGSDGNIWLTANNKAITGNTTFTTVNATTDAASRNGGDLVISSQKKTTLNTDAVNVVGDVILAAKDGDVNVYASSVNGNDISLNATGVASIQDSSTVNGKDVVLEGGTRAQIVGGSKVTADRIGLQGGNVWFENANLKANDVIAAQSTTGYIRSDGTSTLDAPQIVLSAATDVKGTYDLKDNAALIGANNDIDVTLHNVGNRDAGLIAGAGNDVTIKTPGTLSVSRLVSQNGDMTLEANEIIAGSPINNISPETKFADTPEDRALIWVRNGEFKTTPDMTVTKSGGEEIVANGQTYQLKHNIQYGTNGEEKILLINPRVKTDDTPIVVPVTPAAVVAAPTIDDSQAKQVNRIPRQPEAYDNRTNIADGRTSFVDVFAAASQIEIDEEEE